MKKNNNFFNILILIFIIVLLISGIMIIFKQIEKSKTKIEIQASKLPINEKITMINDEINDLKSYYNNQDITAIISIPNTELNTAVVQTTNNDYYLNHSLTKKNSIIGATFFDYRNNINNSKQLNIYGHNSGNYDPPFKVLQNYLNESFYKEHLLIELKVNNEKRIYEIFSVSIVEKKANEEHMQFNFNNDDAWLNHFNNLKNKSLHKSNLVLNKDDNIIVLQTCLFGSNNGKLLIIVGKQIKI